MGAGRPRRVMRIALDHSTEVGMRTGKLLLGEAKLETLGIVGQPVSDRDPRLRRIDDLEGFDVVVTDDPELGIARQAIESGVPIVAWVDGDDVAPEDPAVPLMTGANLATGIALALAAREIASVGHPSSALVAWTEPGTPVRSGEPVTFPDPVGARWGRIRHRHGISTEVVVPLAGEWAGVVVRVSDEQRTRILGIADLATHLEALALTAGAVTIASGTARRGLVRPADYADEYLLAALRLGLDIASFTSATTP